MHLGTYLSQDLMLLDVETTSKEELFALMAARAEREEYVTDPDAFLTDLWEREESASTGLANGVALPHSRFGISRTSHRHRRSPAQAHSL